MKTSPSSTAPPVMTVTAARRPLSVVVTGSTRGLGLALAAGLLSAGDRVIVNSRNPSSVARAVAYLQRLHPTCADNVLGLAGDVSVPSDVDRLASLAGPVDAWVCNAGLNAPRAPIADVPAEALAGVAGTNLAGALLVARAAIRGWRETPPARGGHLFLMEGAGSHGPATPRMAAYGASKRALPFLAQCLRREGEPGVRVHLLSPGMVLTGLLLRGPGSPMVRKVFNVLAEEPETVAGFLVPRIRETVMQKRGSSAIRFLTIPSGALRMVAGFLFGYRKNKFFDEKTGRRVEEGPFDANGVRVLFDESEPIEDESEVTEEVSKERVR